MAADDLVSGKYGLKAVGSRVEVLRLSGSTVVVVVVDGRRKRCKRGFASLQTVENLLLSLLPACVDEYRWACVLAFKGGNIATVGLFIVLMS